MGPVSIITGSAPTTAMVCTRASGAAEPVSRFGQATSSAAAPSEIWLLSAAVTRPPSRSGGSAAIFSRLVSGRGPSSRARPNAGTTSSVNAPASQAATARSWLARANRSISVRLRPHLRAISSAPRNCEISWSP